RDHRHLHSFPTRRSSDLQLILIVGTASGGITAPFRQKVTSRIIGPARSTARAKATVLEAAYRVKATRVIVLIERQGRGRAVGIAVTQARMHAQSVVLRHGHE